MRRTALLGCVTALVLAAGPPAAAQIVPDAVPQPTWGVNREVRALARVGRTLFVGGDFDIVGPPSGGLAIVDAATDTAITPSTDVATANRIAPDGAGGWYAAQWYTSQLDIAVLHVRADGTRDPAWTPPRFDSNTSIYGLVAAGGRVYVSGTLGVVNGVTRPGAVALDGQTGAVLPWTLTTRSGQPVYNTPFMTAAAGRVYFTIVGPAADILAYDAASGAMLPFQVASPPSVGSISQLAATATRLFAIGDSCGPGAGMPGLCAFDTQTGALVWTRAGAQQVWSGTTRVYVVTGYVDTLDALDGDTGVPTGWTVARTGYVADVSEANGRTYMVATRDQTQTYAFAFDAVTAAELAWHPLLPGALSVAAQGGRVAVGGQFRLAGGLRRRHLVALDLDTGRPAAVQPAEPFGAVNALTTYGDVVFVGMESGAPEIFAFSAASGQRFPWGLVPNGIPRALLVVDQTLYIGGFFSKLSGEDHPFLGAVDLATAALLPWNPGLDFDVSELTSSSTRLYAAGRSIGPFTGTARSVAFERVTRAPVPFNPPLTYLNGVQFFAVAADQLLTTARYWFPPVTTGVSWLDRDDGHVLRDVPLDFASLRARGAGDTIVVGGVTQVGLQAARLRAIHATSGDVLPWSPDIAPSTLGGGLFAGITALEVGPDLVAAGGLFEVIGGRQVANLAVFRATATAPAPPRSITAAIVSATVTISWLPGAPGPVSYVVEAGTAAGGSDVGVFPVGSATTVSGTLPAGRYFVRVRAVTTNGPSAPSSEVVLDVPATAAPPQAPSTLSGSVAGGVVTLRWQAAAGNAVTYVIEAGSAPGLANLAVFPTGHLDTTLVAAPPPGTYVVRVRAANAFGVGPASNEVTVVVP